jgi:cytoplasmic iron level regulating protein YaaA (DUF328/UPF0246 family)
MNKIELCLQNKIANSSKLRPTILKAILNLFNRGIRKMTAEMVKNECLLLDISKPWNERIPAICLSMKNATECGGRIIGEYREINGFTIAFDGNILEIPSPKSTQNKDKSIKINTKEKDQKATSIDLQAKFHSLIKKFDLDKLSDDNRPKLLIIGCSDSKKNGGIDNFISHFNNPNIQDNRENSIIEYNNYREDNPNDFNKSRNNAPVDVIYFNNAFNIQYCMRAIDRYNSGRSIFYSNYGLRNLYLQKINNKKLHLLIISGLYGLLRFDDCIPDYHFEMSKNSTWKNANDFSILDTVREYLNANNIPNENVFYSLANNDYKKALKPEENWKLLWINSKGNGALKNSAQFIAEEFLPRL